MQQRKKYDTKNAKLAKHERDWQIRIPGIEGQIDARKAVENYRDTLQNFIKAGKMAFDGKTDEATTLFLDTLKKHPVENAIMVVASITMASTGYFGIAALPIGAIATTIAGLGTHHIVNRKSTPEIKRPKPPTQTPAVENEQDILQKQNEQIAKAGGIAPVGAVRVLGHGQGRQ